MSDGDPTSINKPYSSHVLNIQYTCPRHVLYILHISALVNGRSLWRALAENVPASYLAHAQRVVPNAIGKKFGPRIEAKCTSKTRKIQGLNLQLKDLKDLKVLFKAFYNLVVLLQKLFKTRTETFVLRWSQFVTVRLQLTEKMNTTSGRLGGPASSQ